MPASYTYKNAVNVRITQIAHSENACTSQPVPGPTMMMGQMGLKGSLRVDRRTKMGTRGGSSPVARQECQGK